LLIHPTFLVFNFAITPGMELCIEVNENSTLVPNGVTTFDVSIDLEFIWDMNGWYHQTGMIGK